METVGRHVTTLFWLIRKNVRKYLASVVVSTTEPHYGYYSSGEWTLRLTGPPGWHTGKKALEVGSAAAWSGIAFARCGAQVTAVDISPDMIAEAAKLTRVCGVKVNLCLADAHDLSFLGHDYDLVFSSHALGFVADIDTVFNQVYERLKMYGRFVFCVTHPAQFEPTANELFLLQRASLERWEENRYTINQMMNKLTNTGFLVDQVVPQTTPNPSRLTAEEKSKFPYGFKFDLSPELDGNTHLPHTIIYACRKVDKVSALTPALVGKN